MPLVDDQPRAESAIAQEPVVLNRPITAPIAWRANEVGQADWRVPVTKGELAELDSIAAAFSDYDGPVDDLRPDAFDWPATTEIMVEISSRLERGIGFAVLDRLPVERWGEPASRAIAWLLNNLLAPPIKQKWKGARAYDVRDTGAKLAYGVRRSVTNLEQEFHTDGSFLHVTPDYLSLACLHQAEAGGKSRVASLATVHNRLHETAPRQLERLYRPFWWDRQAEHGEDERPANWLPVFESDGDVIAARYYDDYIRNGYRLMDEAIDDETEEALRTMQAIVEDPRNWIEFRLDPGQILFGQNRLVVHGRTAFSDPASNGEGKRHLLRYWLRSVGGIELEAESPPAS